MVLCAAAVACGSVTAIALASAQWSKQTAPFTHGAVASVSADSASDAWAVGYNFNVGFVGSLIRWDGTSWRTHVQPVVAGKPLVVADVAAVGPNNVWTVGVTNTNAGLPYVAHWVGAKWVSTPLPTTGNGPGNELDYYSIAAVPGSPDRWVVGGDDQHDHPSAAFYNGSSWRQVPVPATNGDWTDVAAHSSSDAWAIGANSTPGIGPQRLVAHWNGTKWSYVADVSAFDEYSQAVACVPASTEVWVVGSAFTKHNVQIPFAEKWNGKTWTRTALPALTNGGTLNGVTALSATDAWAVGWTNDASGNPLTMLTYYWDGKTWTRIGTPVPPRTQSPQLGSVTSVPATGDAWAVGTAGSLKNAAPIILHHAP